MKTYSFLDVQAAIVGPGGAINLGNGAGPADEGITISRNSEIDTMAIGADGQGMHTLHADKSGRVTIRLLKTSPTNGLLSAMYNFQTISAATHGQNTITITDTNRGDVITCRQVAFAKYPDIAYGKEAAAIEWTFNVVEIDGVLAI